MPEHGEGRGQSRICAPQTQHHLSSCCRLREHRGRGQATLNHQGEHQNQHALQTKSREQGNRQRNSQKLNHHDRMASVIKLRA
jgi:hypothetical protein